MGGNDATTSINNRTTSPFDGVDRFLDLQNRRLNVWLITGTFKLYIKICNHLLLLNIFRNVHNHRTGPPRFGNMKCFVNDLRNISDTLHKVAVLDHGKRGSDNIRFLKRVASQDGRRNLPGDGDQRDGVHLGIHDPC